MRPGLGPDELATLRRAYRRLVRRYVRQSASYPRSAEGTWQKAEQVRKVIEQVEIVKEL